MRNSLRHTTLLLLILLSVTTIFAQKVRYVELNSTHALSVPENLYYSFNWGITYGVNGVKNVSSKTNVTNNIKWDNLETYHVSVQPILDSVKCPGESVYLDVIVVEYLSLHTFDDIYFIDQNQSFQGYVGENDFDESSAHIYYNPTPVTPPQHGSLTLRPDGTFNYTPESGFSGTVEFIYEAYNDNAFPMYSNATVTIVIRSKSFQAEVSVKKTGPEKALFGEQITYNLLVKNNGPSQAVNVMLRDTMAYGLFHSSYSLNGGQFSPWNDFLALGHMNSGDSILVTIKTDISPFSPKNIYNQALIFSSTYDPVSANNQSIWHTLVDSLYVDLPDTLYVPSCATAVLPGDRNDAISPIMSFLWTPATGLSDPTRSKPLFTPDASTIGKRSRYILKITDIDGHVASDTMYIIVPDVPVAVITGDTLYKDLGTNKTILGDQSIGNGLGYNWHTYDGDIVGSSTTDNIEIAEKGLYYLKISDGENCSSLDSIVVLLESHPPIAINDSVAIQSASDSTINVLTNDTDINLFNLQVTAIVTEPKHSTYSWKANGDFNIRPDSLYWRVDSLEYEVCNNGYPVKCSTAWIIIDALRPPLNADVEIQKTGDEIAFWGDTVYYDLSVWSNGPDSATSTVITDKMSSGLLNPEYSLDNGSTWQNWMGNYVYTDSLYPFPANNDVIRIKLRAFVGKTAGRFVANTAYVETDILENKLVNDTARWITKIKEPVLADAGDDLIVGNCWGFVELDGTKSTGENLSYRWTPSTYLDDPTSPTPIFRVGSTTTYILTVTDDDQVSSQAVVSVTVLPPPLADAGDDKYIRLNSDVSLDGSGSQPAGNQLLYSWTTTDGRFVGRTNDSYVTADTVGKYVLTVTDATLCTDADFMEVFQFYYEPFAIPDYYSTVTGTQLTGNVLDNDYEPNGIWKLTVDAGTYNSQNGGTVVMQEDGSFSYMPLAGFNNTVDHFIYTVCNDAYPPRCSEGYAEITINDDIASVANLTITKTAINKKALIGYPKDVKFSILVENKGPVLATDVTVTDVVSIDLDDLWYRLDGSSEKVWTGSLGLGDMAVGETHEIILSATAQNTSPDTIFNAATVTSINFDSSFDWGDVPNRNVDTTKVVIDSDLRAIAELVELHDNLPNDFTIGVCDTSSFLKDVSISWLGFDYHHWSSDVPGLFTDPDSTVTRFTHVISDTTLVVELRVGIGDRNSTTNITINFSPEVIADAGEDRKLNEGVPLVLDASNSQGADAIYEWSLEGKPYTLFKDGDPLQPMINDPGLYTLMATDKHGCTMQDEVFITVNELFVVNDFIVLLANDTLMANVSTNDYDPNFLDTLSYSGVVFSGPSHGKLLDNPPNATGFKSALLDSNKVATDGTFIYVPTKNYVGYDMFEYEVCDNNDPDLCVKGKVYIKVIDVNNQNSPPVANPDQLFVTKTDTIRSNLLDNDYDFDGGIITMTSIMVQPTKGTVTFEPNGDFVYLPNGDEVGLDYFVYQICDNGKPVSCDSARVTINIHKISDENHHPVAVDDAYFVVEKPISGNVLFNDFEPDNDEIEIDIEPIVDAQYGQIRLGRDGSFIYTPDPGFEGTDQIVYKIYETRTFEQYESFATIYITSIAEKRYITDVAIVKTKMGSETILSGDTIVYQLQATVVGPSLSNDVVVSDTLFSALKKYEYSADGVSNWKPWNFKITFDRLMLYEDTTFWIRAILPDRLEGDLVNIGHVSHNMNEALASNNTSTVITNVYQKVIADAGEDLIIGACETEYALDGTSSVGMSNLQYAWSPSELLDNPNSSQPIFLTEPGTSRKFKLVVSSSVDEYFDNDSSEVTITVAEKPIARAGEDIKPLGKEKVRLNGGASTGAGPLTYLWWYYDVDKNVIELARYDTVTVNHSGDFYLTVTDIYGCSSVADLMHVTYTVDDFRAVDDTYSTYQQTDLDMYVLRNDVIDTEDSYDLNSLTIAQQPNHGHLEEGRWNSDTLLTYVPDIYYHGPDTFVYIIRTELAKNDGQATVYITVLEKRPVVPGGFSPNGDGINELLIIDNIELYEESNLVVFNRWGNIVYEKNNYSNAEAWDGIANKGIRVGNGVLPAGVYFYILDLGPNEAITERIIKGNMYIASDNRR
ncbi:MAG: Ig-like domain-containing protein [Prolixibacteraceae bacterium]